MSKSRLRLSGMCKNITPLVFCTVALALFAACGVYGQVDGNTAGSVGVKDANGVDVDILPATDEAAEVARLSVEQLLARKKAAVESPEASEETKAKIGEVYDKAIAQLELLKQIEAEKQQYKQARENAPARLVEVRNLLAKMEAAAAPEAAENITLTQAEQSLAMANAKALKDPKPVVIFRGFGSSSLDFELRVYVSGIDSYVPVWHGINCAIDTAFRAAGVEIAFPQQDIHVRSVSKRIPMDLRPGSDSIAPPRA